MVQNFFQNKTFSSWFLYLMGCSEALKLIITDLESSFLPFPWKPPAQQGWVTVQPRGERGTLMLRPSQWSNTLCVCVRVCVRETERMNSRTDGGKRRKWRIEVNYLIGWQAAERANRNVFNLQQATQRNRKRKTKTNPRSAWRLRLGGHFLCPCFTNQVIYSGCCECLRRHDRREIPP